MILGYRLRELRKDNNMSQEELGKLLGVTKVSVSGYENGTRIPSTEILVTILNVFKISADYLLGRELDVICEGGEGTVLIARDDIDIINELKLHPKLYNLAASNPKRFFSNIEKKWYIMMVLWYNIF